MKPDFCQGNNHPMTERREDIALELARIKRWRFFYRSANPPLPEGMSPRPDGEWVKYDDVAALLRPHVLEWIPVWERLPENGKPVLVVRRKRIIAEISFPQSVEVSSNHNSDALFRAHFTHWAALPSAPLSLESSNQK